MGILTEHTEVMKSPLPSPNQPSLWLSGLNYKTTEWFQLILHSRVIIQGNFCEECCIKMHMPYNSSTPCKFDKRIYDLYSSLLLLVKKATDFKI